MASTEELPRALVSEHSSLLAFSSNCILDPSSRPRCDEDAERISSIMVSKGMIKHSNTLLVTTSGQCTKKGLQDAVGNQISKIQITPDGDGLFVFVFCGGACDLRHLDSSTQVSEPASEDGFVNVDFVPLPCTHSLILKDFNPDKPDTYVTGETIAKAIGSSPTNPKQLLIILDCSHAEELGKEIRDHLNSCELSLIVSQGKGVRSYHLDPLGSSTFSYFFCSFLCENCTYGVLKLRALHSKVAACCDALSSLRMVRVGQIITAGRAAPKGRFEEIIKSADDEMVRIEENTDVGDSEEQVDIEGSLSVSQFLSMYYRKYWINFKRVRLCSEAKDWVHAVMAGPLLVLKEHERLNGRVLEAAVSSMMASMATIQSQLNADDMRSSNIFLQAYVYVVAAIDMLDPNLKLFDILLLNSAQKFYLQVMHANNVDDKEIQALNWTQIAKV